jgi:hypothetical protein
MAQQRKFKIGDKVKITKPCHGLEDFQDAQGEVVHVMNHDPVPYRVKLNPPVAEYDYMSFRGQEMEKA